MITKNTLNTEYASEANMSLAHFLRLFKEKTGTTPHNFKLQLRIAAAKDMLVNNNYKVNGIAQSVVFNDPLYFCKYFLKITGDTTSAFSKEKYQLVIFANFYSSFLAYYIKFAKSKQWIILSNFMEKNHSRR